MSDIPQEFLEVPQSKIRHDFWRGSSFGYFWLQSTLASLSDFLETLDSSEACRILTTYFDSGATSETYGNEPGWTKLGNFALSPVLPANWSNAVPLTDGFFIFDSQVDTEA